ncbi:hypothetical protein [Vibrio quintilis]|uniref:Uncharacterized protein n=1 Tax=Vibrio quintilis TaxID=1117707 RepID=A0A1M7YPG8_9VIBR|nr:hypothetical protein [Vibrio quintilis]SHO54406.1 hypothetical protein VQ7734_00120 [Vibrio quintilis]
MAVINAPSMHDRIYVGSHGNVSLETASVTLSKAAADTEVNLLELPIGLQIESVRVISDGIGSTVDIKIGDTTLVSGMDVSTKTSELQVCEHYTTEKANLKAVLGGESTGKLTVKIEYISKGY